MKSFGIFVMSIGLMINAVYAAEQWYDVTYGTGESDFHTIGIDPINSDVVYIGTPGTVLRTTDGGEHWKEIFSTGAGLKTIRFLATDPADSNRIYVATQRGVFATTDGGGNWKNIFSAVGESSNDVFSMAVDPNDSKWIWIGTGEGLFRSPDRGVTWQRATGKLSSSPIRSIVVHPHKQTIVYAATDNELFETQNRGEHWERIFIKSEEITESTDEENSEDSDTDEGELKAGRINNITIDPSSPDLLFLSTDDGLFMTHTRGSSWERVAESGLTDSGIRFSALSSRNPDLLYAATAEGVFEFSRKLNRWSQLYQGITSTDVRYIALDQKGKSLWAVTDNGVFKMNLDGDNPFPNPQEMGTKDILAHFSHEPTIEEIREAAIRYAEVQPEKIENWRKAAAKRAILPDLSVGLDRYVTNLLHWDSGTNPDTFLRGDDAVAWDVSLTWDLGDLVWNPYQKDIDVRSRLMVQLRDDVLSQVTRVYFERRRLQVELLLSPPGDISSKIEKELRLQELTADIDGLTGGYLTRTLKSSTSH